MNDKQDNQARLRNHLHRLGWSQKQLADWLTEQGEHTGLRTVQSWLSESRSGRSCPVWPSLLIESMGPE